MFMLQHLVVTHYHLRPGGVRRVIETSLPPIAAGGHLSGITLATGEAPEEDWLQRLREGLGETPLDVEVHPGFLYTSERKPDPLETDEKLRSHCARVLVAHGGTNCVLWAHNLGLGRNLSMARAWATAAQDTGAVLVSHHHDFFFDNRWARWKEIQQAGFPNLHHAAQAVFPAGARTVHVAINRADHKLLASGFGTRAVWIPNSVTPQRHSQAEARATPAWLASRTGFSDPYWLLPCRLLRRKNIAESVLLARWLRPEARVVTTGAPTSPDEQPYARRLSSAAHRHDWRLDLSVLASIGGAPPVSALIANAEAVLLTSLQEGFGLPYLEAATGERPLVARALPNVMPDLVSLGLSAPLTYEDVLIPCDLFNRFDEVERQRMLWLRWLDALPPEARALARPPLVLEDSAAPVAFSRLTFTAQEDVLSRTPESLHDALAQLNPALAELRGIAGRLPPAHLDEVGRAALSPSHFGEKFWSAVEQAGRGQPPAEATSWDVLQAFLADRLGSHNIYPMLLSTDT